MLNRVRLWIRSVVLRRRLEREMQEEMAEHLERSTARLMQRGLSREEARLEAMREFGNVTYLQEEARYARGTRWLDALIADSRFALRHFARKPMATATMFAVLTIGMSISTLLFSYVHMNAVQPPLGITAEDDLVRIRGSQDAGAYGRGVRGFSEEELLEYRALTDHFEAVAGWTDAVVGLDAGESVDRRGLEAKSTFVTENYFPVLGVRPVVGPGLPTREPEDPAMAAVAVIGYTAWNQLFGRSPEVIGSTVSVNGVPVTIVGVAPERFIGVGAPSTFQLWMPLSARRLVMAEVTGSFRAAGRLRPDVSRSAATAAAQVVAARIAESDVDLRDRDPGTEVVPLLGANGDPMFDRDVRLMSFSLGLLGLLVLLVTCTNVSALLTGLAMARRQEIAIRLSLGAGRRRLIRQLLTESALLASVAGAAALGIVWLVLEAIATFVPGLPFQMGITWPATLFTFGVALVVGVLFGLSPSLHATRLALAGALRDSTAAIGAGRGRLQRALVVAQIAFTQPLVVLLSAVLVLILTQYRPESQGEFAERLISLSVHPTAMAGGASAAEGTQELRAAMQRVTHEVRATPGVEAAVIDWPLPPPVGSYAVHADDRVDQAESYAVRLTGETASPGYFGVMGIPLVRGRDFTSSDASSGEIGAEETPVVIGADLARRLWAGADPLGRRLEAASDTASGAATLVVVGVIEDPKAATRRAGEDFRVYLPPDTAHTSTRLLVRTVGDAELLLPTIRGVVRDEAPGMAVRAWTLAEIEDTRRRHFRLVTGGVSVAGLMALLLSAIGLYAVVAFSVGQRTAEIAVRIAVGARARQIVRRFVVDGLRLSAIGLAFGLPVSLLGLDAVMGMDDDIPSVALSSVTAIAALGVVLVATAAAWIPARRAASVDPATTLRSG